MSIRAWTRVVVVVSRARHWHYLILVSHRRTSRGTKGEIYWGARGAYKGGF